MARPTPCEVITAVDTSVLLDIFGADSEFGPRSAAAMRGCLAEGCLVACEVVWAETAASFATKAAAETAFTALRVDFSPLDASTSLAVGQAWRAYRQAGGSRERVIADFLIGAHALAHADRLLTRDRGFYRRYFSELRVEDPSNEDDSQPARAKSESTSRSSTPAAGEGTDLPTA